MCVCGFFVSPCISVDLVRYPPTHPFSIISLKVNNKSALYQNDLKSLLHNY